MKKRVKIHYMFKHMYQTDPTCSTFIGFILCPMVLYFPMLAL